MIQRYQVRPDGSINLPLHYRNITAHLLQVYDFAASLGLSSTLMNGRFQNASFIIEPGVTRHRKVQVRGLMRTASRAVNNSRGAALEAFAFGKALITPCDFIKHSFVAMFLTSGMAVENIKEIPMAELSNYRSNSTQFQRCFISQREPDETDVTNPGRAEKGKAAKRRSLLLAIVAAALALVPLSFYGLVGAQNDSQNAGAANEAAAEDLLQFNLVAADAVAACFPDSTVKVRVLPAVDELGTDTLVLTGKRLPPNTTFAVFLTELPAAPFGATQFIARITTNGGGKVSTEVRSIIEDAFVSQPINGQRVRTDLNHVVLWFANPGDAEDCFAPNPVGITPFDADGNAGPSAFSSRNALPGAPLP